MLEAEGGQILLGSNDPLPVDRAAWTSRLETAADYLGGEVEAVALWLRHTRPPFGHTWLRHQRNEDLFPRDEFASP